MAANYWSSTQRRYWTFTRPELALLRTTLATTESSLIAQFPLPERRLLNIYIQQQIQKLSRRMPVRQQAQATAQIYVKRFYTRVEMRRTNLYLVISTAFYLACKMEECPQHIRVVFGEARQLWPADLILSDISKLGECEFHMISELSSRLICHHPYRSLTEVSQGLGVGGDEMTLAWNIVNDHYLTDLPLLYPPHVVAVTAIFLAVVLRPTQTSLQAHAASGAGGAASASAVTGAVQAIGNAGQGNGGGNQNQAQTKIQKLINFLAESQIDLAAMVECTQEIISLYELWEQYNDKVCKEQVARFVKARGLDKN